MKANGTIILLLFLVVTVSAIFGGGVPSGYRRFLVENRTGFPITITAEMAPSQEVDPYYWWGRSLINEHGEEIWFYVVHFGISNKTVLTKQLQPGSFTQLFQEYRDSSVTMSPLDKLKLLYSCFIITDEQGNIIKTLDSFTEDDFIFDNIPTDERPIVQGSMMLLIQ